MNIQSWLDKSPFFLLVIQVLLLAYLSIVSDSTEAYTTFFPICLWIGIVGSGIWVLLRKKSYRVRSRLLFHLSFVVILVGALITHLTAFSTELYLQKNIPVRQVILTDSRADGSSECGKLKNLPFAIVLNDFQIDYYPGTDVAADYKCVLTICKETSEKQIIVSMNNIYKEGGYRLYHSSYDEDLQGCSLMLVYDRWGILVTYAGYLMLLLSIVYVMVDKNSEFRKILKNPLWKSLSVVALILVWPSQLKAVSTELPTFDERSAHQFGQLLIQHQNRVTTIESYANDFVRKIYGKTTYKGYTPVQVLSGWIFAAEVWQHEPMIKVKGDEVKKRLNVDSKVCFADCFLPTGEYILQKEIGLTADNYQDKRMKNWVKLDEKIQLIVSLKTGNALKLFPMSDRMMVRLLSPKELKGKHLTNDDSLMIHGFFPILYDSFQKKEDCSEWIQRFATYQRLYLQASAPSKSTLQMEHIYYLIYQVPMVSYLTLTVGMIAFFLFCIRLTGRKTKIGSSLFYLYILVSVSYLTLLLLLRTFIAGRLPFSNGYETLLTIAWLAQVLTIWLRRRVSLIYLPGLLVSGFAMLTASISDMDPQITPLIPVLNSPLLSIHVSLMMIAYTLAGFMTLIAITALILKYCSKEKTYEDSFCLLNRMMLYPTVFCMAIGIFTGAVWANVSWGSYWSWDPKETWALISMLVYGFAFHFESIHLFRKPLFFQVYLIVAFLTILITYFGVNYYLGGMHSYANM